MEKHQSNPNSPFNVEFKKERKFFRKENKKKIIMLSMLILLLLIGSIDFMNSVITKVDFYSVSNGKKINILKNECNVYVYNKSPYKIILIIPDNVETNYNGEILEKNIGYYYWFIGNGEYKITGVKK